jgi:dolichol-phosphate mannosyltransferase
MVVPVYNEEGNIRQCAADALAMLTSLTDQFELIFVESGSTDKTGAIADELAEQEERIKVLHQGAKKGLGNALKQGYAIVANEWVFYTDGDNAFDMSRFREVAELLKQPDIDVVNGRRMNRTDTLTRAIYTRVYNFIMHFFFGVRVRDNAIGFKAFKRKVLDVIELHSDSMFFSGEVLAQVYKHGFRVTEVEMYYRERTAGASTVNARLVMAMIADIIRYALREIKGIILSSGLVSSHQLDTTTPSNQTSECEMRDQ